MNLLEIQRRFTEALTTPLNSEEGIAERTLRGEAMQGVAQEIVKPNDRLSSVERLEIYSRSYWFRIISSLNEDFVGLRAVVGDEKFDALVQAYLTENPSRSFTLRNLGSRLESWLRAHREFIEPHEQLALDMVRLEWADTECFDAAEEPALTLYDIARLGQDPTLRLQPHIQLLDLHYPVDKLLLEIREEEENDSEEASNTFSEKHSRARVKRVRKSKPKPTFVVVHRVDYLVYFKRLTPEAFRMLQAIGAGKSLSEAIDLGFNPSTLAEPKIMELVQGWFREWTEWKWFANNL
ncbi:MAG: putative DNA-binding domain-containing protein [Acidobacteria bacterium]|nr:putative DNA-binding domain-containing protein [Acidobacteriota bacterium]